MLILKYDRLDFFNHRIYTEDKKENYTRDDLKKVFAYFSKTHDASIQIDNVVVYWDSLTEYENRVVTVRNYDGRNYNESKKSFDKVKKEVNGGQHVPIQNPNHPGLSSKVCKFF